MPFVEVCDEPGLGGLPPEQFAGERARGGGVEPKEPSQPSEMLARVLGRDRHERQLEMPPDDLGDVADRDALVGHGVQRRSRRGLLESKAEEASGVEAVYGGPAVGAVTDVAGDAL